MDLQSNCENCGAPLKGHICPFCGTSFDPSPTLSDQMIALDQLHAALSEAESERRVALLTAGYIPEDAGALIEAGVKCIPLVNLAFSATQETHAAVDRLRAITAKLRILDRTPETSRAIGEFSEVIRVFDRKDRSDTLLGCSLLTILVIVVLIALVYYFVR